MSDTDKLIYGLAGAFVALVSAQLAALLTHVLTAKREQMKANDERRDRRRAVLREKLETVVKLVEDSSVELRKRCDLVIPLAATMAAGTVMPWKYDEVFVNDSFVRAQTLVVLYLSSLQPTLLKAARAAELCRRFIDEEIRVVQKDPRHWLSTEANTYWERWETRYAEFKDEWVDLQLQARELVTAELLPPESA